MIEKIAIRLSNAWGENNKRSFLYGSGMLEKNAQDKLNVTYFIKNCK